MSSIARVTAVISVVLVGFGGVLIASPDLTLRVAKNGLSPDEVTVSVEDGPDLYDIAFGLLSVLSGPSQDGFCSGGENAGAPCTSGFFCDPEGITPEDDCVGNYSGEGCIDNTDSITDATIPAPGDGVYYIARSQFLLPPAVSSWESGGASQFFDRGDRVPGCSPLLI